MARVAPILLLLCLLASTAAPALAGRALAADVAAAQAPAPEEAPLEAAPAPAPALELGADAGSMLACRSPHLHGSFPCK